MIRRHGFRIVVYGTLIFLFLPFLIPLPPSGVDAVTLAEPDGFFIEVDGLQTYVLARGPEDGEPVLLLHGWGASTFTWRENIDALAEAGFRAIAFDRPPYGLSAKTGANIPYSSTALAEFTAHVMDTLDIKRAILVGQSQGGGVAGYFAMMYPKRVSKLVLVSAALRPTDDPLPETGGSGSRVGGAMGFPAFITSLLDFPPAARWAQIGMRVSIKPDFVTDILKSAYYDPAFMTPEVAEGYQRQLQVTGWDEALLNQLRMTNLTSDPLKASQIAAISVPVMIVWGEEDTWVPLAVGERLRELLPESTWHVYPQAGHLVQEEAAADFNRDLLAFLME
jgi:pimeloyl-ACP methyl ester carboxylesterase